MLHNVHHETKAGGCAYDCEMTTSQLKSNGISPQKGWAAQYLRILDILRMLKIFILIINCKKNWKNEWEIGSKPNI